MPQRKNINRRNFLKRFTAGIIGAPFIAKAQSKHPLEGLDFPRQVLSRGKSVMQIIEGYPEVNAKEVSLFKLKKTRGQLYDGMVERREDGVLFDVPPTKYVKSYVHTHPMKPRQEFLIKKGVAPLSQQPQIKDAMYLSHEDISRHFAKLDSNENRVPITLHVSAVNEKGKIIGHTSMYFGKQFLEKLSANDPALKTTMGKLLGYQHRLGHFDKSIDEYTNLLLSLRQHGVKFKATPAPGYVYKNQIFEKK